METSNQAWVARVQLGARPIATVPPLSLPPLCAYNSTLRWVAHLHPQPSPSLNLLTHRHLFSSISWYSAVFSSVYGYRRLFLIFSFYFAIPPPPSHVLMTSHDWLDMFVNGRRRRSSPRVAHLDERNFGVSLIAIQSPSISNKWNRQLRLCMVMMDFWNHLMKKSNVMTKARCYRVKWNFCWPNIKRIFQIFFVEITKTTKLCN